MVRVHSGLPYQLSPKERQPELLRSRMSGTLIEKKQSQPKIAGETARSKIRKQHAVSLAFWTAFTKSPASEV